MEGTIYVLCAGTALACGILLLRGHRRSRVRLLLWCGIFFLALMFENLILFIDLILLPATDLSGARFSVALAGAVLLLYGLVWEVKH